MKCQKCNKPATFHITEIQDGKHIELHLCEEHARGYLTPPKGEADPLTSMAAALTQQLQSGENAEEMARLDQRTCPICGITFREFRSKGRLGCAHDYVSFFSELEPLILNIHGETEHTGKRPRRGSDGTGERTRLIRLRREMKEAVAEERYERASHLRDEIRRIERDTATQSDPASRENVGG